MANRELKSQRFRNAREWDWRRLEGLLRKMESKSLANLSDEDLLALPVLYRSALSSLSVARATSLDKALVEYLESLCSRAYFFVYGPRSTLLERVSRFFSNDLPNAVASLWRETLASFLLFTLGAVVAYILVARDPDWFYAFMGHGASQGRDPTASTEFLRSTLYDRVSDKDPLSFFATFLFTHNAQIAILAFALGFAFCLPTALLLVSNGFSLGALLAIFVSRGLGVEAAGWLAIHGVTEIFAVILAGAAGLRIGWTLAFPGKEARLTAMARAGRLSGTVMGGVVLMLLCAGLLEGFARQMVTSDILRFAIAGTTGLLWACFYYLPKGAAPHGQG
ncbi:stage II sporulation protein M [soil metagenome]